MNQLTNLFLNAEEAGQVEQSQSMFLNVEPAKEFINSCKDPADREILWTAFGILGFRMAPAELAGTFDVLFFARAVAELLKDREHLRQILSGNLMDRENRASEGNGDQLVTNEVSASGGQKSC
jgi:hypothetical protein